MTTPRVPVLARRLEVYGALPWAQSFRFKTRVHDESGAVVAVEVEDLTAWTGWEADWRPDAESATKVDLQVDVSQAAAGVITVSATEAQTLAMDGNGVLDLRAELAGVPRAFFRAKTAWTLGVTRD
jgi:hypothetical protein